MKKNQLSPFKLLIVSILFYLFPFGKFARLRSCFLRWAGAVVGNNVRIMPSAKIKGNYTLIIGDNVFIGHETLIFGARGSTIEFEDNTTISSGVIITTGTHRFSADGDSVVKEGRYGNVKLCSGSGVLAASVILPGSTIGRMALVAAGSVVTKDVPEFHLVAGCPARIIRDMREDGK